MLIYFSSMQLMEESRLPSLFKIHGYAVFSGQMKMTNLYMFMLQRALLLQILLNSGSQKMVAVSSQIIIQISLLMF